MRIQTVLLFVCLFSTSVIAQKKSLTHEVYDGWKSVQGTSISNNGDWIVYSITPQDGDATLQIYSGKDKTYQNIPRGERPRITYDNDFVIFRIKPFSDTVKMMRRQKVKKSKLPTDTLGIYNLASGELVKIPKLKSFNTPAKAGTWLAYQAEAPTPQKKPTPKKEEEEEEEKEPTPKKKKAKKESSKNGYKLIIRNLTTSAEDTFYYVTSYTFTEDGSKLAFISTGKDSTFEQGIYVMDLKTKAVMPIFSEKGTYKSLTWDEKGSQLAFLADTVTRQGHGKDPIKFFNLYHYKNGEDKATILAGNDAAFLPKKWMISEHGNLRFSKNGDKLFFGTAPIPMVQDTTLLPEEIISVEVWHWKDPYLYPQQNVTLKQEQERNYLAVARLNEGKIFQLGTPEFREVMTADEGNAEIALGRSNTPYGKFISWEGYPLYFDLYLIDLKTGNKELIKTKAHGFADFSPKGKYLHWYSPSDTAWLVHDIANNKTINLTGDVDNQFWSEFHDYPNHPNSYGMAGWTDNDERLLIYDRWDIWAFDPSGNTPPQKLTNGRAIERQYRFVRLDPEARTINPAEDMLLHVFNNKNKAEGYYSFNIKKGKAPVELLTDDFAFSYPVKAKDAKVVVFNKRNFQTYPDIYCANLKFTKVNKISDANPQMKDYLWGTVEMTSWNNLDGEKMDGLIYKPENFDPTKKYPMMVYFYERYADRLHTHYAPAPIRSIINFSYFTSNGYVVFVPDVKYKPGFPGQSAYNCVIPGVLAMIDKGYVDKDRIGVQGHSWGGYQIAYLVTKTDLFKCAEAGAPVSNMTSAYGGIRWASGLSRMFQYEHTQSRIGGTLWEKPSHYIENSPLFRADDINTPLLMMHNDNDGAVPWYQGIELFVAMRRLGKPVWMLNYNGEAHGLQKRHNKDDFAKRLYQFFDYYLKDAPMPEWMESGVPAIEKGINTGLEPKADKE